MAWRYHSRYFPDPYAAKTRGTCDRCQFVFELNQLNYQYEFRGDQLSNTYFRVCPDCMDKPYEGNRPIKLPPDPLPAIDPRVEPLQMEENAVGLPIRIPPLLLPPSGNKNNNPVFIAQGYTTEDGSSSYVTEDGSGIYVPE